MKHALMMFTAALLAAVLLLIGYLGGRDHLSSASSQANTAASSPEGGGKKVLYWYDTMVPQQHFDKPGLSPMGMQMVPKYADEGAPQDVVRIDPATVQNLGLRTAK